MPPSTPALPLRLLWLWLLRPVLLRAVAFGGCRLVVLPPCSGSVRSALLPYNHHSSLFCSFPSLTSLGRKPAKLTNRSIPCIPLSKWNWAIAELAARSYLSARPLAVCPITPQGACKRLISVLAQARVTSFFAKIKRFGAKPLSRPCLRCAFRMNAPCAPLGGCGGGQPAIFMPISIVAWMQARKETKP